MAEPPAARPLIVEKVNENQLVTLKGNTPVVASAKNDLGRVAPGLKMSDLILVLRRSPEQKAAFDAFVASQYDPGSPNFHHWLEPEEVGTKFGPALADIATVSNWLAGHGFSVDEVSKDRMTIRFSGTAAQVEATFHTEIHNLTVKGEPHISNMTDPQIPMALDPVVLGPKALHNFFPRPMHRLGDKVTFNRETGQWQKVAGTVSSAIGPMTDAVRPLPQFGLTGGTPPNTYQIEDMSPFDFAAIYNVQPLWNSSIDGTGQTIGVVGTSDVRASDVASFKSTFGLPAGLAPIIKLAHGNDPGACTSQQAPSAANNWCTLNDQIENALDVEWAGAVAPGAQVVLVVSGATSASDDTVFDSANYAIQNNTAKVLNVSYGLCELGLGTAGNATYGGLWQTAASQGIAVFVASGDSGSPACDQGMDAGGTPYEAQFGLSVSGLASTPYNTAVGGTDLNWGSTASPYWNSTNNASNGSSAKGYMPETPWNDSCTNPLVLSFLQSYASALRQRGFNATSPTDAESACNFVVTWNSTITSLGGSDISFLVDTVGAGGGKSNCTTNDGSTVASCAGGYAKPSWQAAVTGIPNDGKRDIPDVSFFASNGFLGSAYLICVSDWGPCISRSTTTEPSAGEIGGTSAASPAMAGVMALINQKAGTPQGSPNSQLYQIAAKQTYSNCSSGTGTVSNGCYFNDIDAGTSGTGTNWAGTISMPCAQGSPNCTISHSGDTAGVLSGFDAATGFDLATGLGTLNVANVVNAWTATGIDTATVTVTANPTSITSLQGTAITVSVAGSSGTPTGTVFLKSDSFVSATHTLAADGTTTFNISPGVLAGGTDTVSALYSGDPTYSAATGSTTVTVTQATYSLTSGTPSPASFSRGGTSSSTIAVSSSDGYAGSVSVTCALTSSPAGANDPATCAVSGSPVTLSSTTTSANVTVTVGTTAATAALKKPPIGNWEAGSGAVLALLVFFGIPARRRGWRAMLGIIVLLMAFGSFSACGGGGGSGGGGGGGNPGTTAGNYTFTVTGTGNPALTPAPTTTFTVTVN